MATRHIAALLGLLLAGCHRPAPAPAAVSGATTGDLDQIAHRGELRVLVDSVENDLLAERGPDEQSERLRLADFAREQKVKVRFVPVERYEDLLPALNRGEGDLVAADMVVTDERKELADFARPLAVVDEVLVGKKDSPDLPRAPAQLSGRTVHVRWGTPHSFQLRALGLADINVVKAPQRLDGTDLALDVAAGRRPLTVVDSVTLRRIQEYEDGLVALFPVARDQAIAWAVRKDSPKLRAALDRFLQARELVDPARAFVGDLGQIKKRGVLRMLTRNDGVSYFLDRGSRAGFDYEIMKMAADELGVQLEVVVAPGGDQLLPWLLEGRGDVVAAQLAVTPERAGQVSFSEPYLDTEDVVVKRSGDPLASVDGLAHERVHVRRSSSFATTLTEEAREHPIDLVFCPESVDTEELINQVGRGEIPLTVASRHVLEGELRDRDDVEEAFVLASGRPLAFAVRPGSPALRDFLDGFVRKNRHGLLYNIAYKRYFEHGKTARALKELSEGPGRISPFDDLFRQQGAKSGFDWRLLAAQAFQESHFDPNVESAAGALGLMQLLPSTAASLGCTDLRDPAQAIAGGSRYLKRLFDQLEPELTYGDRMRLALASYNAGMGHVEDARRVAAAHGLSPDLWEGNVERGMLLLQDPGVYRHARYGYVRGTEPTRYVREILQRYASYAAVMPPATAER